MIAALALISAMSLQPQQPTGFLFRSIEAQGREYRYAIFVPRDYSPEKKWPVILYLHGMGESGTDGQRQLAIGLPSAILLNAQEWPFIVVAPQKPNRESQWGEHAEAAFAMLELAEKEYSIDTSRRYLTGLSQGGAGTWALAARKPELWTAIAPVCGYGDPEAVAPKIKDIPTWAFHGEADPVVKVSQTTRMIEKLEEVGGKPKVSLYPNVTHNSWDKAYREEGLGKWFLSHQRSTP
jgi:predicted peptidase